MDIRYYCYYYFHFTNEGECLTQRHAKRPAGVRAPTRPWGRTESGSPAAAVPSSCGTPLPPCESVEMSSSSGGRRRSQQLYPPPGAHPLFPELFSSPLLSTEGRTCDFARLKALTPTSDSPHTASQPEAKQKVKAGVFPPTPGWLRLKLKLSMLSFSNSQFIVEGEEKLLP